MFDDTLQSEDCAWLDDDEDEDYFLFEDDEEEDDEDEVEPRPRSIEYRCSPGCRFSPTVRALVERHLEEAGVLLNVRCGALVVPDLDERLWRASYFSAPGELEALLAAWTEHYAHVVGAMVAVTPLTARTMFARVEHDVRDLYVLTAAIGLNPRSLYRWSVDWSTQLGLFERELVPAPSSRTGSRWETSAHRKHFYRCRDQMRAADPAEREAYRTRDTRRRKTQRRKDYLAAYEARPDVRAKRAEQKRLARAAARARLSQQQQEESAIAPAASPNNTAREPRHDAPVGVIPSERGERGGGERDLPSASTQIATAGVARIETDHAHAA